MRISDWSSDVCSSDLRAEEQQRTGGGDHAQRADQFRQAEQAVHDLACGRAHHRQDDQHQQEVADLEHEPAAPEQHPEERAVVVGARDARSEEHTSELQSLMRISYAVFCLKKKKKKKDNIVSIILHVKQK